MYTNRKQRGIGLWSQGEAILAARTPETAGISSVRTRFKAGSGPGRRHRFWYVLKPSLLLRSEWSREGKLKQASERDAGVTASQRRRLQRIANTQSINLKKRRQTKALACLSYLQRDAEALQADCNRRDSRDSLKLVKQTYLSKSA